MTTEREIQDHIAALVESIGTVNPYNVRRTPTTFEDVVAIVRQEYGEKAAALRRPTLH